MLQHRANDTWFWILTNQESSLHTQLDWLEALLNSQILGEPSNGNFLDYARENQPLAMWHGHLWLEADFTLIWFIHFVY